MAAMRLHHGPFSHFSSAIPGNVQRVVAESDIWGGKWSAFPAVLEHTVRHLALAAKADHLHWVTVFGKLGKYGCSSKSNKCMVALEVRVVGKQEEAALAHSQRRVAVSKVPVPADQLRRLFLKVELDNAPAAFFFVVELLVRAVVEKRQCAPAILVPLHKLSWARMIVLQPAPKVLPRKVRAITGKRAVFAAKAPKNLFTVSINVEQRVEIA